MMQRPSWCCTFLTQLCLCVALYVVLHIGQPQTYKFRTNKTADRRFDEVYFISVRGGFRPLPLQNHLLKQMDKAAKIYKARFVVNISELGKDDPLQQNVRLSFVLFRCYSICTDDIVLQQRKEIYYYETYADHFERGTARFPSLKIPWYTTINSREQENFTFMDHFKLPHGTTIDIIGLNMGSIEDILRGGSGDGKHQLHWLTKTFQATDSNWRIVAGFQSMVSCNEQNKRLGVREIYEPIHEIFVKSGVSAYLSLRNCSNHAHQGGISYIGNPSLTEHEPFLSSVIATSNSCRNMLDGFLLHRVSSLEIVTYFVSLQGEVVDENVIQQGGREMM